MKLVAIIGFVLISALCIYFCKEPIESDLITRSKTALEKENLDIPKISFEGRDAYLSGVVDSESIKAQVENVVDHVYGVRVVQSQLTVKEPSEKKLAEGKKALQKRLDELLVDKKIEFAYNSAEITQRGHKVLDEIAEILKKNPDTRIEIIGHTDAKGNTAYNQKLSQLRAQSVMQYLIAEGIESKILSAVGRGSSQPIADNSSTLGQDKNRRVEFKVKEED
jgi:outer membrane protein OmpA-like peptidoglycan-associated protein